MTRTQVASSAVAGSAARWPRWRVVAIRIWAGLLTLQMLMMAHGVLVVASVEPDLRFMAATSTVWKLMSLGGVAFVLWTGGRTVLGYWAIAIGQLVWAVAGVVAPQPDGVGPLLGLVNLVIFYGPLVALRPRRRELLRPQLRTDPFLLAVAASGSVPMVVFGLRLSTELDAELRFDMVGLYFTLSAMAAFAGFVSRAGRPLVRFVGAGWLLVGLAGVLLPDAAASPGRVGGALLMTGGLLLVGHARA